MKKKVLSLTAVLVAMAFLAGCASVYPIGVAYTEVKLPAEATGAAKALKVWTSECISVLSLVAIGDASIEAAMKNGGIKKIHHVDWDAKNILGLFGQYKTTVYGE
ncbi:MAG: TRL-like family protein [Deltaproteobacteria bacterium]|nr:TRL-like family protein [Deltaproteobacteria bacterium]